MSLLLGLAIGFAVGYGYRHYVGKLPFTHPGDTEN